MVGWHCQLNGREFEQTLGDNEEQGSLASVGSQRGRHDLETKQQQPQSPHCFAFCSFAVNSLKSESLTPSTPVFFLKIVLAIPGLLCFHIN